MTIVVSVSDTSRKLEGESTMRMKNRYPRRIVRECIDAGFNR
jgi:hypothetical protein